MARMARVAVPRRGPPTLFDHPVDAYGNRVANNDDDSTSSNRVDDRSDSDSDDFRVLQLDHRPKIDFYNPATPHTAVLEFKEGKQLYVVSEYLAQWSSVYKNLLNETSDDGNVFIANASAKHFNEMLQVIHASGKFISAENCGFLLKLAVQFDIPGLVQMCANALKTFQQNAKMKHILDILDVVFMNKFDDLKDNIVGSRFDFDEYTTIKNVKSLMGKAFGHLMKLSVETREFVFHCIWKLNEGSKKNKKKTNKTIDRSPKFDFMNEETEHDKTIVVEDKEFFVKAKYLAMWSDYFEVLFFGSFKESDEDRVVIQDISAEHFEEFLNVIYPSQKPIDKDNCASILKLAFFFAAPGVIQKCSNFMYRDLHHHEHYGPEIFETVQVVFDHNMEDLKMMFACDWIPRGHSDRLLGLSTDVKDFLLKTLVGDFEKFHFVPLDRVN